MIDGISIGIKLPTVASFLYVNILVDMIIKIKNKKILVDILIEKSISLAPIYKHAFITCSLILKHVYFHIHTRAHTQSGLCINLDGFMTWQWCSSVACCR